MLYLALDFKYISLKDFKTTYDLAMSISQLLSGFIKKLWHTAFDMKTFDLMTFDKYEPNSQTSY